MIRAQYRGLFKQLVRAFHDGRLEELIGILLAKPDVDPQELTFAVASLCGVTIPETGDPAPAICRAMQNYATAHRVVEKNGLCFAGCVSEAGGSRCARSCPFNAIIVDHAAGDIRIDRDKCTGCGLCVDACGHNLILDKTEYLPLAGLLRSGEPVIAAVAPAIMGQFGDAVSMEQLRAAFRRLGFRDMVEVAFFADMLTLNEAIEFNTHVHTASDFMITSCCCPMWVAMLRRVYHQLVPHVTPSVSPMVAAGRILKQLDPGCKVVFVGPCIAKKSEAKEVDLADAVDFVLTFTELKDIFDALEIDPGKLTGAASFEYSAKGGRLYARTGGVSVAVGDAIAKLFPDKAALFTSLQADGVKACKDLLVSLGAGGTAKASFIEGMGCVGGCVGGPRAVRPKEETRPAVDGFAALSEFAVAAESPSMNQVLHRLGIRDPLDFADAQKTVLFKRSF